jgi:hypothetical protein
MAALGRIARICRALSVGIPLASLFVVMTVTNAAAAPASSRAGTGGSAEQIVAYGNGGFEWG